MNSSKFSFSIKKPLVKNSPVEKSISLFNNFEENEIKQEKSNGSKNKSTHKKDQTTGKITQITSFSNVQSEVDQQSSDDEELIIECKNSLKLSKTVNNIEILLNKKNSFKSKSEDDLETSVNKDSFTIPVEKFGIAMLRGMGYNPEIHNTKPKIFKKRNYNQSGLGADKEIEIIPKK